MFACMTGIASAQGYATFTSDEYGFTMKYPDTWVKIDNPRGNYYKVFQAPDLIDNFRSRIHVAAHKPVTDKIEVFLKEMRNGIKDLQTKANQSGGGKEVVRILDEGPFACDVPGAYYFFIQALEDKLKIWMDIVIVFYKHDKTLLRISCLAPSKAMERFHQTFNEVLVSVRFPAPGTAGEQPAPAATTAPAPAPPTAQPAPAPTVTQPAPEPQPTPAPATPAPEAQSVAPPAQPAQPSPPSSAGPTRGQSAPPAPRRTQPPPSQGPTGIVR
jgi:hypothetical protein